MSFGQVKISLYTYETYRKITNNYYELIKISVDHWLSCWNMWPASASGEHRWDSVALCLQGSKFFMSDRLRWDDIRTSGMPGAIVFFLTKHLTRVPIMLTFLTSALCSSNPGLPTSKIFFPYFVEKISVFWVTFPYPFYSLRPSDACMRQWTNHHWFR